MGVAKNGEKYPEAHAISAELGPDLRYGPVYFLSHKNTPMSHTNNNPNRIAMWAAITYSNGAP